jgi:hypothetical protein
MTTILLGIGFLAVFFALMSVRLFLVKDGKFKGTCASQSPFLAKEGGTCGYCGRKADGEGCGRDENTSENEVDNVMAKFN